MKVAFNQQASIIAQFRVRWGGGQTDLTSNCNQGTSTSIDLDRYTIPDGTSCWAYAQEVGNTNHSDESAANFTYHPGGNIVGTYTLSGSAFHIEFSYDGDFMSTTHSEIAFNAAQHAKLATIDSAKIIPSPNLLDPALLQVVAQPSGINQEACIVPLSPMVGLHFEYWPYEVVEHKTGPGWPPGGGIGPELPPVTVHYGLYQGPSLSPVGSKGIAVVGARKTFKLDFKPTPLPPAR
jgi:hypothetical protein